MNRFKFLTLMFLLVIMASCQKSDQTKEFDKNYKISVTGKYSVQLKSLENSLESIDNTGITDSLEFITKYGDEICCKKLYPNYSPSYRGMPIKEDYLLYRDLERNKIKFYFADAFPNSSPTSLFYYHEDIVMTVLKEKDSRKIIHPNDMNSEIYAKGVINDTVAYIPNSIRESVVNQINEAFNKGDYDTCYKLFDDGFVFIPTTGEKWRKMKEAGIE